MWYISYLLFELTSGCVLRRNYIRTSRSPRSSELILRDKCDYRRASFLRMVVRSLRRVPGVSDLVRTWADLLSMWCRTGWTWGRVMRTWRPGEKCIWRALSSGRLFSRFMYCFSAVMLNNCPPPALLHQSLGLFLPSVSCRWGWRRQEAQGFSKSRVLGRLALVG